MKHFNRILREFFHSINLTKVAATAEQSISTALVRVAEAEAALKSTRASACSQLAAEQDAVAVAVAKADEQEAEREKVRGTEVDEAKAAGKAKIDALIAALEQAKRNADEALAELNAEHSAERNLAKTAKEAAQKAIEDLAAARARIFVDNVDLPPAPNA